MISFDAEENNFLTLLKDLNVPKNKGIIISLNTTCVCNNFKLPPHNGINQKRQTHATCNIIGFKIFKRIRYVLKIIFTLNISG